jgi:hypothetical protein
MEKSHNNESRTKSTYDVRTNPYYHIQLLLISVGHVVTGSFL